MLVDLTTNLLNYVRHNNLVSPVLLTFTSKYSKNLQGKFRLLRRWQEFRTLMTTKLPYREYRFNPICWSIEESENSVHLHCIAEGQVNARALNHAWVSLNRHDLGKVDVRQGGTYKTYLKYIFKSVENPSKLLPRFIGHFVTLRQQGYYTLENNHVLTKKRKRNRLGQFARSLRDLTTNEHTNNTSA